EKSWNTWKDSKIPVEEYDNKPLNGFVLNKDVGGSHRSYGWNSRREKVRAYDPRGFEIEITVDNLLYILQECSSIKGKGLEGEFVYAWKKNSIVLLPTDTKEYKKSLEYTDLQKYKITKKEMVPGCLYLTKENKKIMYLGRHNWYEFSYPHKYNGREYKYKKKYIFIDLNEKVRYYIVKDNLNHLSKKISEKPIDQFSNEYEVLMKVSDIQTPKKIIFKKISNEKVKKRAGNDYWTSFWIREELDDGEYKYTMMQLCDQNNLLFRPIKEAFLKGKKYKEVNHTTDRWGNYNYRDSVHLSNFEEVGDLYLELENGYKKNLNKG
ncbi:MAG: hypothetical protein ACOCV1_08160, partial [Bacillota bacterium]